MNNLILVALLFVAAGAFWAGENRQIAVAREDAAARMRRQQAVVATTAQLKEKLAGLNFELSAERQAIEARRVELHKIVSEHPEMDELSPTPADEGVWPNEKQYFYLSKNHLGAVRYQAVAEGDVVSDTAATLLGMSANEHAESTAAYRRMLAQLRGSETRLAIPTNAPARLDGYKGEKTSLFLPKFSTEDLNAISDGLRADLTRAVGAQRGELLASRVNETLERGAFGLDHDRTITVIQNGDDLHVAVSNDNGFTMTTVSKDEKGAPKIPAEYAHLFPEK